MFSVLLISIGIIFFDKVNSVSGNTREFTVRLNNSFWGNSREGRLEIYYSGQWGTVCDDHFTNVSARVACASLGFGYIGEFIGNRHGPGTDPIWLDDVNCTGTETGIEQCPRLPWSKHNCNHGEDVSIVCAGVYEGLSGSRGTISSPNYPMTYANNLDCYYYIPVLSEQTVTITFVAFSTQSDNDWLTIACESRNTTTSPRYSGSQFPPILALSSCNRVNVYFHTDGHTTSKGFNLTYSITKDCSKSDYSVSSGRISSPNFPAYLNYLDCSSYISVQSAQTVIITFQTFYTESRRGWVTIKCESGKTFTSPHYSGPEIPAVLTISSCNLVTVSFHTDSSTTCTRFSLTYRITSDSIIGGFTAKPFNAFPRSDKGDHVIFNCTTTTGYLPWWTFSDEISNNYTMTNSTCGIISSAPYSCWLKTESFGRGSCNLIVDAPASYLLAGSVVCTDSTLRSARAIVVPISLELRSVTVTNISAIVSRIVRDEERRISCNPSFNDRFSSPSKIFTHFLYHGGPAAQLRILRTYWTSEGNDVPSANDTLSTVVVKAPNDGTIPQYTCNIVFDFYSNVSDLSDNFPTEISISTEPLEVLYWPSEDNMTIVGDNNGQMGTPALLYCYAASNPSATYSWIDESNGDVSNGPTIIVNHEGKYTCIASNVIRGQIYQQSKSIDVQVLPQLSVPILGSLLGVSVLTIIIILVILFYLRKRNAAENLGHKYCETGHELGQRGARSNAYDVDPEHVVDLAESEDEDVDAIYENCVVGK